MGRWSKEVSWRTGGVQQLGWEIHKKIGFFKKYVLEIKSINQI
jgi:hypothetical protein